MLDCYSILELPPTASQEEVKNAYKKLAKLWHPDKNPDNVEEATVKFKEINIAFKVLSDENQRAIYDHIVEREEAPPTDDQSDEVDPPEEEASSDSIRKQPRRRTTLLDSLFGRKKSDPEIVGPPTRLAPPRASEMRRHSLFSLNRSPLPPEYYGVDRDEYRCWGWGNDGYSRMGWGVDEEAWEAEVERRASQDPNRAKKPVKSNIRKARVNGIKWF